MYYQTESQGMQLAEKIKATRIKCLPSGEPVAKAVPVLGKFKTGSRAGLAAAAELKQLASVANTKFPNLQTQLEISTFNHSITEKKRKRVTSDGNGQRSRDLSYSHFRSESVRLGVVKAPN